VVEAEAYTNMRPVLGQVKEVSALKTQMEMLEERLNDLEKKK
jgi:ubiquinone biosynthesis protein UbiJ